MPAEYERWRDALIASGMSAKEAKKRAAIRYWKKHGVSVNAAHKKGKH